MFVWFNSRENFYWWLWFVGLLIDEFMELNGSGIIGEFIICGYDLGKYCLWYWGGDNGRDWSGGLFS